MEIIQKIVEFLAQDKGFTAFVNIVAIIGFIITVWVFIDVGKLKDFYMFKGRVPQHTKNLLKFAASLAEYMNDFDNTLPQSDISVVKLEVELESLSNKLDRKGGQTIKQLLEKTRIYIKNPTKDIENLREIHRDLHRVIAKIQDLQEDLNWEK